MKKTLVTSQHDVHVSLQQICRDGVSDWYTEESTHIYAHMMRYDDPWVGRSHRGPLEGPRNWWLGGVRRLDTTTSSTKSCSLDKHIAGRALLTSATIA